MAQPRFQTPRTVSFIAEVDLTAKKYFAVKLGSNDQEVDLAGANEGIGILMNSPNVGETAEVAMLGGGALGNSGAAIAKGAVVRSDAAGKLVTAVGTNLALGIALSATSGADEYFEIERVYYIV